MPTYEYECLSTGKHFDVFQNITDEPIKKCPECSGKVRRLMGAGAAVIFKGKGFYATDYAKSSCGSAPCGRSKRCCGRDEPCDKRSS